MTTEAFNQLEVFDAAKLFIQTEGIIPAPEPSHAIWNASLEQQVTKALALHAAYVGSESLHQATTVDRNPGQSGRCWPTTPFAVCASIRPLEESFRFRMEERRVTSHSRLVSSTNSHTASSSNPTSLGPRPQTSAVGRS